MKQKEEQSNPPNLYRRGDSWIVDFYFRGERYTENIGPVSRTVAKEIRDKRKGAVAAGELAVNSNKRWIGKNWVAELSTPAIEDPLLEDAIERYLEWYQANKK